MVVGRVGIAAHTFPRAVQTPSVGFFHGAQIQAIREKLANLEIPDDFVIINSVPVLRQEINNLKKIGRKQNDSACVVHHRRHREIHRRI